MSQEFWKKWSKIYLPALVPRLKWTKPGKDFKVGDLVLLKVTDMIKNQWSRARITKILPNKDGFVRCVEVTKSDKSTYL